MPVKSQVEISCDLCQWPGKIFESEAEAKKKRWVTIIIESYHDDRSFSSRWICPSCVDKVIIQGGLYEALA